MQKVKNKRYLFTIFSVISSKAYMDFNFSVPKDRFKSIE